MSLHLDRAQWRRQVQGLGLNCLVLKHAATHDSWQRLRTHNSNTAIALPRAPEPHNSRYGQNRIMALKLGSVIFVSFYTKISIVMFVVVQHMLCKQRKCVITNKDII